MKAILVQGMAWGDESKGATVDKLSRSFPVDLIVRFGGGAQCAHNVVTPEGVHHTFAQFGSGMLANSTVRTHLSRFVLVNPINMMAEAEELSKKTVSPWARTTVSPAAVLVTPWHALLNRYREDALGPLRHGSCGQGIGVAREWALEYGSRVLQAGDVCDWITLRKKLKFMQDLTMVAVGVTAFDVFGWTLDDLFGAYTQWKRVIRFAEDASQGAVGGAELAVFEGHQGVMLDETHGTAPHNTWTDCTFGNADKLLDEVMVMDGDRLRIGCFRSYYTRHGDGPFPTQTGAFDEVEYHNKSGRYQGKFRTGEFDWNAARFALEIVGGLDCLAVSHTDVAFTTTAERINRELGVYLGMVGRGPTADHRELLEPLTRFL